MAINYGKQYNKYKSMYLNEKHNMNNHDYQNGGSIEKEKRKGKNWILFTNKEKQDIMNIYNKIIKDKKKCMSYSKKDLDCVSKGMFLKNQHNTKFKICDNLIQAFEKKTEPIIQNDSLTAWCNKGVELYGLEIRDILKMKKGDKIDVVLMDRNIGDYMDGTKKGTKYNPLKEGLVYAVYTHNDALNGVLYMKNTEQTFNNFKWELNVASLGSKWFWGPLKQCYNGMDGMDGMNGINEMCGKCDELTSMVDIKKLDPKIKVGWRGPAIRLTDAKQYLPKTVKHYDNWWNDYSPFRYRDYLNKN